MKKYSQSDNNNYEAGAEAGEAVFPRTDLACESTVAEGSGKASDFQEHMEKGIKVSELTVHGEEGEKETGRPAGRYVTLTCPVMRSLESETLEALTDVASLILRDFVSSVSGSPVTPDTKILVAGLGNRFITADAIGPRTADKISVTGHVTGDGGILEHFGCCSLSAIHPGVLGQTGIEAADIVRGAAETVRPHAVVVVDALAARSTDRLAATIQISDSGIHPGSGIGNRRTAITSETIGCPVVAVGVPTVVDSSTLVYDALEKAEITQIDDKLREVLENGKNFFVSLKDSDVITDEVSDILAFSINKAFYTDML